MGDMLDETRDDWTIGPDGYSNTSLRYRTLVGEVERMIRSSAFNIVNGQLQAVAGLIVSQLAHVYGLTPKDTPVSVRKGDLIRIIPEVGEQAVREVCHIESHIITMRDV